MEIPVYIEPRSNGFRASTASPLPLSAEGETADAAMDALRDVVAQTVKSGGQFRSLRLQDIARPLSASEIAVILETAKQMRENPLFEEFEAAIEDYRREHNMVPELSDPS